jgi:thiol-disulfide isomerase/thioredoxin
MTRSAGACAVLTVVAVGVLIAVVIGLSAARAGAALPTIPPEDSVVRSGPIARGSDDDAAPLIGAAAPDLPRLRWLDGRPRGRRSLEGHVVVIRSFTNECPFCAATMPALERIRRDYAGRGLVVLGVYHPKPPRPIASADVAEFVASMGATFPVAVDTDWRLVDRWWRATSDNGWTSISWILDRGGVIRYVHPGGEYHEGGGPGHARCRDDERAIRRTIERLLDEDARPNSATGDSE